MKKLLLSLMVLATLASCGKDNKVSSVGAGTSAITINDQSGQQLGSMINASETYFGNGLASNNLTWNQALLYYPYYSLKYGSTQGGTAGSNCQTKWTIFYVCTSGSTSTGTATVTRSVALTAAELAIAAKRVQLASIVNSAVPGGIQVSSAGTSAIYYVRTTTGVIYTIDTRLPIQANPSATQQVNGQIEYFLGLYQ